MVTADFWTFLFSQFYQVYVWMRDTPAVSYSPVEGVTLSVSFFALFISYLVIQVLITLVFFFVKYGDDVYSAFSDDD